MCAGHSMCMVFDTLSLPLIIVSLAIDGKDPPTRERHSVHRDDMMVQCNSTTLGSRARDGAEAVVV